MGSAGRTAAPDSGRTSYPTAFVGRDEEMDHLRRLRQTVASGESRLVLVSA